MCLASTGCCSWPGCRSPAYLLVRGQAVAQGRRDWSSCGSAICATASTNCSSTAGWPAAAGWTRTPQAEDLRGPRRRRADRPSTGTDHRHRRVRRHRGRCRPRPGRRCRASHQAQLIEFCMLAGQYDGLAATIATLASRWTSRTKLRPHRPQLGARESPCSLVGIGAEERRRLLQSRDYSSNRAPLSSNRIRRIPHCSQSRGLPETDSE